jgi:hypothetical protein
MKNKERDMKMLYINSFHRLFSSFYYEINCNITNQ